MPDLPAHNDLWNVSVIAWGRPGDPTTSSGYARSLSIALRDRGRLRRQFSAKAVRPWDACWGALGLGRRNGTLRPVVRRAWMWSERGSETLSRRLNQLIRRSGDTGPFLQVGTLINVDSALGPHFMRTDMTVIQAARAGHFAVAAMTSRAIDEAVRLQCTILSSASHVFAASEWTARSLRDDCGVPAERVSVVYTGGGLHVPDGVNESKAGREILFVGLDWERKGGPLLLEAFRRLRSKLPDATLRIVGCTPGIRDPGVLIEGRLSKADPAQYERLVRCYLRASCFCLPTLFDPFPNVIIEAASVGLATVAINNGSRSEAIIDGQTGALVSSANPEAIAVELYNMLHDMERCHRMGAAARNYARSCFSWDQAVARIGSAVQLAASRTHADTPYIEAIR